MSNDKSQPQATKDRFLDLTSRVYKLVVERGKEGVLQSELWKLLSLTSRDGSRLAIRLEHRGIIKRDKLLQGGRWTYKLTPLKIPVQISSIEQAPCITCPYESSKCTPTGVVSPLGCVLIADWVTQEYTEFLSKRDSAAEQPAPPSSG